MREGITISKYGERVELKIKGGTFSIFDPTRIFVNGYWDYMGVFPVLNGAKNILLLGLGGGTISRILLNFFPDAKIDGVDDDGDMIEFAKENCELENPNLNIIIKDAEDFLKNSQFAYDLILQDTFIELDIPNHLSAHNFFALIKSHLNENGIFCLNVAKSEFADTYAEQLSKIFQNVYLLTATSTLNTIIISADSEPDFEKIREFEIPARFEVKKFNTPS